MLQGLHWRVPITITLGAIVGSLGRYYLTLLCTRWLGHSAYGTLLVNLLGAWAIGFSITLASSRIVTLPPEILLLFNTGFLGSLTTFSTYTLDTLHLARTQTSPLAFFYWFGSATGGVASLYFGVLSARLVR